jgi:hypothetical protein
MNREVHVRFCEGLGCNSLGLLTYGHMGNTFAPKGFSALVIRPVS